MKTDDITIKIHKSDYDRILSCVRPVMSGTGLEEMETKNYWWCRRPAYPFEAEEVGLREGEYYAELVSASPELGAGELAAELRRRMDEAVREAVAEMANDHPEAWWYEITNELFRAYVAGERRAGREIARKVLEQSVLGAAVRPVKDDRGAAGCQSGRPSVVTRSAGGPDRKGGETRMEKTEDGGVMVEIAMEDVRTLRDMPYFCDMPPEAQFADERERLETAEEIVRREGIRPTMATVMSVATMIRERRETVTRMLRNPDVWAKVMERPDAVAVRLRLPDPCVARVPKQMKFDWAVGGNDK